MDYRINRLDIDMMGYQLAGGRVIMNAHRPSWFERLGADGSAIFPELRAVFPKEHNRLARFQRRHGELMILEVDELKGSIERRPMHRTWMISRSDTSQQ